MPTIGDIFDPTGSQSPERMRLKAEAVALMHSLESQHEGLDLWIQVGSSGQLEISKIVLPKAIRGKGVGTVVMRALCDFADQHSMVSTLSPDRSFGGSLARLKVFYRRFGFVPNSGRNRDYRFRDTMLRQPEKAV